MQELSKIFETAAGQKVNLDKSSVFFSKNTRSEVKDSIIGTLEMRMASDNSLYIGLPSTIGRNKFVVFASLKDKMRLESEGGITNGFLVQKKRC